MTLRYLSGVKSRFLVDDDVQFDQRGRGSDTGSQTNLSSSPRAIYRTRLRPPRTLFKARKSVGVDLTRSSRVSFRADLCTPSRAGLRPLALRFSPFAVATCNGSFTSTRDIQSLATNVGSLAQPLSIGTGVWYHNTAQGRRLSLNFMPKRGTDADSRIFFDQLVTLAASRLKATGAIRLEDRHGIIAFGNEDHGVNRVKCVGVAHTKFPNGGSWSYFICPRCGGRKKKLWLVEDAPRCLSCCWSLGARYRSAYGFGRSERLRERDRYVDNVQARRLRGRKRRLTMTMRRSMIVCRLAQLAHQQKAKDGSDEPLPFMRAYQPRKGALEAIPDLKRLWKAQTAEALEQALDQAQIAVLDALRSDDIRKRIIAASLMLKTRAARQRGWT